MKPTDVQMRPSSVFVAGLLSQLKRWIGVAVLLALAARAQTPITAPVLAHDRGAAETASTWTADNGNGTFTNPLFYDEFSDPDLIRVGDDFYLTGTTMHAMPGLPILRSKDLVNWQFLGYALDRLDLGPEFRLEEGKEIYGQGIWAPSFRYHAGTYHIFSNINHHTTQHFTASNPAGPWQRVPMKRSLHDLSVLFDDDGKTYVVWGYRDIQFAQLNEDLTDIVPGTQRTIIDKAAGMGEGLHFYKIDGRYVITSAWFDKRMRMACARASSPDGPYEVNLEISADEDFGLAEGKRLQKAIPPFHVVPANPLSHGHLSMHQGGIVQTPAGEWWGFSMMDANSVGRVTCLSPVTWKDGWPYFGLPGNLGRTPRTWIKPKITGDPAYPSAPYTRGDDFAGPTLNPVWQWNHVPDDTSWSLTERPGFLRLHAVPAPDFWRARNTLTQRAVGPESTPTVVLDASAMKPGDRAGLGLLNLPWAWIAVHRTQDGLVIEEFDQITEKTSTAPLTGTVVWLRVHCDFLTETATFSFSTDGKAFQPLGGEFETVFQLKTFQGVRYALFNYNDSASAGGYADFDSFSVEEPRPHGLMRPIPLGRKIVLAVHGRDTALGEKSGEIAAVPKSEAVRFTVVDQGMGRVALRDEGGRWVSVGSQGVTLSRKESGSVIQWIETIYGDLVLLSLSTDRYLRVDPSSGTISANHVGPEADRRDGSCFEWSAIEP